MYVCSFQTKRKEGTSSNKNSFKETWFCSAPAKITDSAGFFLVSTTMSLIARRKKKNKKPYCLVRGRFVHFLKSRVCVLADLKG